MMEEIAAVFFDSPLKKYPSFEGWIFFSSFSPVFFFSEL